ncbi:MAG: peptidylprolyl isomerase [Alphaproteobacteria bacterium]|nr:peptidylprolyl isomerase [Alphaproteobacteria bacterium]
MKKLMCCLCVFMGISSVALAQEIKVVVNDDLILDYDIDARAQMMSQMMGVPVTENLKKEITEKLIEENIKVRTAQKKGIDVSKEDVAEGIAFLEKQNGMQEGTLLKVLEEKGVDTATLIRQIEADIAWMKYIQSRGEQAPVISDEEISTRQKKMEKELKQGSYLLAEIYIPYGEDKVKALEKTQALFGRIVAGESFPDIAKEASSGKTASVGGDMGWVPFGTMEKAVEDVLQQMHAGQMSKPIEGEKGYYLMLLRDVRTPLDSTDVDVWNISQMLISKKDLSSLQTTVQMVGSSCDAFTKLATEKGMSGSGNLGDMVASRMPEDLKGILKTAEKNKIIGPIDAQDFVLYLMKCDEKTISVLPPKEEIKMQILSEKMEEISARILSEFVKKAVVERR